MNYIKVTSSNSPSEYVMAMNEIQLDVIEAELMESKIGDTILIELVEFDEKEYEALPEFEGF